MWSCGVLDPSNGLPQARGFEPRALPVGQSWGTVGKMMPKVPQNRKGCGEASRSGHQCEMRHAGVVFWRWRSLTLQVAQILTPGPFGERGESLPTNKELLRHTGSGVQGVRRQMKV